VDRENLPFLLNARLIRFKARHVLLRLPATMGQKFPLHPPVAHGFSKTCNSFVPHSFAQMAAAIFIPNYTPYFKAKLQTISDNHSDNHSRQIYWPGNNNVPVIHHVTNVSFPRSVRPYFDFRYKEGIYLFAFLAATNVPRMSMVILLQH
jgi:hypothetical protein